MELEFPFILENEIVNSEVPFTVDYLTWVPEVLLRPALATWRPKADQLAAKPHETISGRK